MHRLKNILHSVSQSTRMSSMSKKENHYDVLKVTPNSTQNDIKSAYYRLSKMYHPDINETVDAKEKFRKISEAYEILGHHESKRKYDQLISIKGSNYNNISSKPMSYTYHTVKKATTNDPRIKAYRDEAASYGTGTSYTYNYDAWTRAHYERSFQRSQKLKEMYNSKKFRYENVDNAKHNVSYIAVIFMFFTLTCIIEIIHEIKKNVFKSNVVKEKNDK